MNNAIFREYDIRGLVKEDLTPEIVESLGKALGTYLCEGKESLKLAVGRDNRLSSDSLKEALYKGLLSTGAHIVDIGVVPTPLLYFAVHTLPVDGGVMITGSHNPPEFNGFKICKGTASVYGPEIQQLCQMIEQKRYQTGKGEISFSQVIPAYHQMLKEKIKLKRPLKVVVDAGNGTGGIAANFIKSLGCEVIPLYCESDGAYPNHHPDPSLPENLKELIETVLREKADFGIAYDGDSDRLGVIDEQGNILWGDQLLCIFAKDVIARGFNKIIFEVKCSQVLIDEIKRLKGEPIMWKTGHSLIKKKMKETKAGLAGEMSGHLFFADDYFGYDDAIYSSCRLLQIVSQSEEPLSHHISHLPKSFVTPEIRIDCPDDQKFQIVEEISNHFSKHYETITVDGVRAIFPDGWGLVRASNTQPVLVLRCESATQAGLERIKQEIFGALDVLKNRENLNGL